MRVIEKDGIKWFLKEEELKDIVNALQLEGNGRRYYYTAPYKEKKIFIKLFLEKGTAGALRNRFSPRGEKEYKLSEKLKSIGICTPEPFGYGSGKKISCVIEEFIEGESFIQILLKGKADRATLFSLLSSFLNTLKKNHIRHNDLHLDNILIYDGKLYLIDLHKMKFKKRFTLNDEVSNLTHALAMVYDDMKEKEKEAFFSTYGSPALRSYVEENLQRLRRRWIRKKKKRAFEATSKIKVADEYLYLSGYENCGKGTPVEVIKDDRKVRVERYTDHVRKYYRNKKRLERAWKTHVVLAYMNYTMGPAAYYVRRPSLTEDGYIAMEDLKDRGEEFDRYLDRHYGHLTFSERKILIDKLARFFQTMFQKNIVHKDCKGCNVYVCEGVRFLLLDMEDVIFRDIDEERLIRMLVQLNTTIPRKVSFYDRMRFFLRLTTVMKIDMKKLFSQVVKRSLIQEIIYEGVQGIVREQW